MDTQPDRSNQHEKIDLRMRTLRTLWLALFVSILLYYILTFFLGRDEDATRNSTLSLTLIIVAFSIMLISSPIKNKLLTRAVEQQQVQVVQQAYFVTWAVNEAIALLGLLDFFVTGNYFYHLFFLVAAADQLFHYPRREHVENAAFKRTAV